MNPLRLFFLLAGMVEAPAGSGDITALHVCDRVGDTIDAVERDALGLFPGIPGFVRARFAAGPGSEAYAFVDYDLPEGRASAALPLSPSQLERIRFLAGDAESVRRDEEQNVYARLAVRRFWSEVELAGSFDGFAPSWGAGEEATPDWPGKAYAALHGATVGSCVGGCAASQIAASGGGGSGGYGGSQWGENCGPVAYSVNQPAFCGITGGSTLLGVGVAGGLQSARDDGRDMFGPDLTDQRGVGWRTGLTTFLMAAPGVALGGLFAFVAHSTLYGRELARGVDVKDDRGWRLVPAIFTGVCIAVEFTVLGYKWGRSWEPGRERWAAKTGYALDWQPSAVDTARSSSP